MTMTYKIQDTALSHYAFTLSFLQHTRAHKHTQARAHRHTHTHKLSCKEKEHVSNATSIRPIEGVTVTQHSMRPVSTEPPAPLPPPPPLPTRGATFLSHLITDHLNRAVDPPLWPQPKTRRPKPCDRWAHVVVRPNVSGTRLFAL